MDSDLSEIEEFLRITQGTHWNDDQELNTNNHCLGQIRKMETGKNYNETDHEQHHLDSSSKVTNENTGKVHPTTDEEVGKSHPSFSSHDSVAPG